MSPETADTYTRQALEAGGWADMRPVYRALLRRLKETDRAAFDDASRRFASTVEPGITAGELDPVAAWVEYGAWMAARWNPGRLVGLDETGLARPAEPEPLPGHVLLFLPDAKGEAAIPILRPARPSPAQEAALELLAR